MWFAVVCLMLLRFDLFVLGVSRLYCGLCCLFVALVFAGVLVFPTLCFVGCLVSIGLLF